MAAFDYSSSNGRWQSLRQQALRRDRHRCQEAKRYGNVVDANTVHHIWPAEDYPEFAYCLWNLVSLSSEAHDAMHDRKTRKLTAAGLRWKNRTPPPLQPLSFGELTAGRGTSSTHGGNFSGEENGPGIK